MASRGKTTQLDHMYTLDLETCDGEAIDHIDQEGFPVYQQRVWLCGYKNLQTNQSTLYTDISDLMRSILARGDNQNTEYAIHNLKFDGSFIVPWLLNNGYDCVQTKPSDGEFSVLIDDRNNWYTIQVQVTKRRRVLFWDTVKLFPTALEYLHEVYGTPTHKIHEDASFYELVRKPDHAVTDEEKAYFENDLQVLAETLRAHVRVYGLRFKKTQASQSFNNFEQSFKHWKMRFPPLEEDEDAKVRKSYWGGISYAAKEHKGKDHHHIGVFDINSSYPYQLATKRMPYGKMIRSKGLDEYPDMSKFWVAEAYVQFTLKENCVPCIPTKAITENRPITFEHWLTSSEGVVKMVFCNIDFFTMQMSYDIEVIQWLWSYHWAWKRQKEIANFVNENNTIKVEYKKKAKDAKTDQQRMDYLTMSNRAKIDNNSFYGKFGEEIIKQGKTPHLDSRGGVDYRLDRWEVLPEAKRRFLPLAIATTAWGRRQLVQFANLLEEDFLYCDTDSVHYLLTGHQKVLDALEAKQILVDDTKLGSWKLEGYYGFGRYLRPKCYMEQTYQGKMEVTLAGLPADRHSGARSKERSCCTKDNFHIGLIIPGGNGKLRTIRTKTGSKLVPTDYRIDEGFTFMLNKY